MQKAVANAWRQIEQRLRSIEAQNKGKSVELMSVSYDSLPGDSVIEELPEVPKSSRPSGVSAAVRIRATYVMR
ncbi:MAG TPA: hypothetical protein VFL57_02540 [Bryobacteraceae bacterium]|nr:hypothetical protein [Bryobacteraceae bacterium]